MNLNTFIKDSYILKSITRYNNTFRIKDESVAEHSAFVALIVLKLFDTYDFNLTDALALAISHDLAETIITDIPHNVKEKFPSVNKAIVEAEESINPDHFFYNWHPNFIGAREKLVVKYADVLSCAQYIDNEISMGNNTEKTRAMLLISKNRLKVLHENLRESRRLQDEE